MQKLLKKLVALCTAFALAATMTALPASVGKASAAEPTGEMTDVQVAQGANKAASKSTDKTVKKQTAKKKKAKKKAKKAYMSKLKLRWTLKPNKKMTITESYAGIGAKPSQMIIKNYKAKSLRKKPGYKMVTFDVVRTLKWKLTPEEVHKICTTKYYVNTESINGKGQGSAGGGAFVAVVDRATGKSLNGANSHKVTVSSSGWEAAKPGPWISDELRCHALALYQRYTMHVAITFPKTYKNLVIGVGGYNRKIETKADKKFWDGTGRFGKTSYYKLAKTENGKKLNSYWMRVK